jgi:tyrosyl-tRNA synthetase
MKIAYPVFIDLQKISYMGFIEELKWRGMLQDHTPEVEEYLRNGVRRGYIGFDPTAPSLTIGNFVQIMILTFFQRAGHQPVVLMGGATGRIGDPSGKDEERQLKSYEELDNNLQSQIKQVEKLLDFTSDKNKAILVNNLDFYKHMLVIDFLRDVGKTLTVNYMMSKESVQKRLETGISYTEFSYQLLQAYDFQCLYKEYDCRLQMGGSDQWGNITSGAEFIRRNLGEKAYAVTTPLITKADGSKFGKSTSGNIWLDPDMTSPYAFYQFWINAADSDLGKLFRYFSLRSREEIEQLESTHADNPRALKAVLAEELTKRVHSDDDYRSVQAVSQLLFSKKLQADEVRSVTEKEWKMVAGEIPTHIIDADQLKNGTSIVDLLAGHSNMLASKGEARRAIKGNAISINKNKVTDVEGTLGPSDLLHGKYVLVENGKKNKYLVIAS